MTVRGEEVGELENGGVTVGGEEGVVGKGILWLTWLEGGQGWVVGGRRNGSI